MLPGISGGFWDFAFRWGNQPNAVAVLVNSCRCRWLWWQSPLTVVAVVFELCLSPRDCRRKDGEDTANIVSCQNQTSGGFSGGWSLRCEMYST